MARREGEKREKGRKNNTWTVSPIESYRNEF